MLGLLKHCDRLRVLQRDPKRAFDDKEDGLIVYGILLDDYLIGATFNLFCCLDQALNGTIRELREVCLNYLKLFLEFQSLDNFVRKFKPLPLL